MAAPPAAAPAEEPAAGPASAAPTEAPEAAVAVAPTRAPPLAPTRDALAAPPAAAPAGAAAGLGAATLAASGGEADAGTAGGGGGGAPAASPSTSSSPSGRDYVRPPRTWANIVSKDLEGPAASRHASSSASAGTPAPKREGACDESRPRKDTIIDYLLWLSKQRAAVVEGKVNGHPPELPEELRKFRSCLESGVNNISKAKYVRRGMKNDANNCYVNVVIQSLLPCSALMQLLSHCAPGDPERPFYTGMVRLCKEFHSRKPDSHVEAFNVLQLPQVKDIISTWQSIGAQQDAGEFLFYMLNGMHEECKWKVLPSEPTAALPGLAAQETGAVEGEDWSQADVRSAGVHEDSPILRIFGGLIRSSVRSQSAKADSVSLEPFNHLILDISSPSVDSVWSALEAYCGAEAVNEGRATKRLQFQMLPKVLIVNLKRFLYNKDTGCVQKIKKRVEYEEKLTFDRSWLVDDVEPPEYQLGAVICHHGDSANGGHYNAAVRYNSEWYMYDDAIVRQMELREVMNQQFTAYLLLYQCHDKVHIRP